MQLPLQGHCGTVAPIWIKGKHPFVAEGTVTSQACINFFDLNSGCVPDHSTSRLETAPHSTGIFLRPTYSCDVA